jgi:hypothetical protein
MVKCSFFAPSLGLHVVNVGIIIFIAISIHFLILADKGSLVEGVFVWQVASLGDLILRGV